MAAMAAAARVHVDHRYSWCRDNRHTTRRSNLLCFPTELLMMNGASAPLSEPKYECRASGMKRARTDLVPSGSTVFGCVGNGAHFVSIVSV